MRIEPETKALGLLNKLFGLDDWGWEVVLFFLTTPGFNKPAIKNIDIRRNSILTTFLTDILPLLFLADSSSCLLIKSIQQRHAGLSLARQGCWLLCH